MHEIINIRGNLSNGWMNMRNEWPMIKWRLKLYRDILIKNNMKKREIASDIHDTDSTKPKKP